jgi:menaquinol-cytochrome c reductase cytochrome b/c subunit
MAVMKEKPTPTDEARAGFARYKDDVKKRGKSFYPYAMFHDTIMSLIVVAVIVGLAVIWKWTSYGPHHNCMDSGILGQCMGAPADPGTTSFVPRPDWYFYFLFYLLRIFKWPDSVFLGTVGLPTILLMLLIGLPFLDRRRTRKISQRPVAMVAAVLVILSMGVLTWKGATAKEALKSEIIKAVPGWKTDEQLPQNAFAGAQLFAQAGCTACHTYDGSGGSNLGAPDLTSEGVRDAESRKVSFQIAHLKCPSCVHHGSPMPPFASLPAQDLTDLAQFLVNSKGKH